MNLPADALEKIREAIRRPVGTFGFEYISEQLTQPGVPGGVIFELAAGGHVFRLERTEDLLLNFLHSSPGTGTRIASVDLKTVPSCTRALIAFTWSPDQTTLYFRPRAEGAELVHAKGQQSQRQLRVGKDGAIYQLGDKGVKVLGATMYRGGTAVLQPTALDAWQQTLTAVEVLGKGQSPDGEIFDAVVASFTISTLATGLEAYTKARFLELEQEGIAPDVDQLVNGFFPKPERDAGIRGLLEQEAASEGVSTLQIIVARGAINFQNYDACKRAYSRGYGIKFGDIGVPSTNLARMQRLIGYRHRIVHVSPLLPILNHAEVPPEEPELATRALAEEAVRNFREFIAALHQATLALRPRD